MFVWSNSFKTKCKNDKGIPMRVIIRDYFMIFCLEDEDGMCAVHEWSEDSFQFRRCR